MSPDRSVYVSSTVLAGQTVSSTATALGSNGARNVEWSGGHPVMQNAVEELRDLSRTSQIDCRLHNYFPPPESDFVLNLATADSNLAEQSVHHVQRAIDLSEAIGAREFGVHAGFFFDPDVAKLGGVQAATNLWPRDETIQRFVDRLLPIQSYAEERNVRLYVENNVLSQSNAAAFRGVRPMMLLTSSDWQELKQSGVKHILLDIAHLYVTCRSLGLNYESEVRGLFEESDYIHVSGNDGRADTNDPITDWVGPIEPLRTAAWTGKTATVEVYTSVEDAIKTQSFVQRIATISE